MGYRNHDGYLFRPDNVRYFFCRAPVTELRYALGTYSEQRFDVLHSQNITRNLNISAEYRRTSSAGQFLRQRNSGHALSFNAWFRPLNRRYNGLYSFIWNRHDNEQNGGLVDTGIFQASNLFRPGLASVRMNDAKRSDGDRLFRVTQYLDGGHYKRTAMNDSVNLKELVPSWRINVENSFKRGSNRYTDESVDSSNYAQIFYSADETQDTIDHWKLTNQLSFIWLGRNPFKLDTTDSGHRFKASLRHELINVQPNIEYDSIQYGSETDFENFIFAIEAHNHKGKLINYDAKASWVLRGYQDRDFNMEGTAWLNWKFARIFGGFKQSSIRPYYIAERTFGNHHNWFNQWNRVKTSRIQAGISDAKNRWMLRFSQWSIADYLYFNENAEPAQLDENLLVTQLEASAYFQFRKWNFKNHLKFQNSNRSEVPIPQITFHSNLYYHSSSFDDNLEWQAGLLFKFISEFRAPEWDPSIGQFYLSDQGNMNYYPVIDLFLALKISRFRFFLRSENLNQGLGTSRNGYFIAPYYPMAGRHVKIGLSWLFVD